MDNELTHYGTPHAGYIPHSGRYKYGSGENPYQREDSFLRAYKEAHAAGVSDKQFADERQMSTTELKARLSVLNAEQRAWYIAAARRYKAKGWSNVAIAEELLGDKSKENTVRNWLKVADKKRATKTNNLAAMLEEEVKEKGCIDVGTGVERELGVSKERLNAALLQLKDKGYAVGNLWVEQVTNPNPENKTTMRYLAEKGTKPGDLYDDLSKIKTVNVYTPDNGSTFWVPESPKSVDSSRIYVNYNSDKDGTIELRRGVEDISLGSASYAQVRIAVDDSHYIKGMALYTDNIPKGYDILINSNKKEGTPLKSDDKDLPQVLKPLKSDPDNPFGATIKAQGQRYYADKNGDYVLVDGVYKKASKSDTGTRYSLSPINILRDENDWDKYSRTLSSQFLAKQDLPLIKQQLKQTYQENVEEYNDIMRLTNSTVRKKLLMDFAEGCDASTVDLKATAFPRQSTKVLLPLTSIKETEVYAPAFKDGEHIVLIRYPYAGTFESPELIVNNRNKEGREIIGNKSVDAIGLHPNTAKIMSGADFDGDTAMAIPVNDRLKIKTSKPLEGLKGFDPSDMYGADKQVPVTRVDKKTGETVTTYRYYRNGKSYKIMSEPYKQQQMGVVSNLITDMTLQGADEEELARAVRHSMVVIDAVKHKLDYESSYNDNAIEALKQKYQKHENGKYGGASTLISRAKAETRVPEQVRGYEVTDPETGETKIRKAYSPDPKTGEWPVVQTGRTYTNKKGETVVAQTKGPSMSLVKDARELSTGNKKEEAYASYANDMKALANKARKEALAIKTESKSPSASKVYAKEVESLNNKLDRALRNSPKERQAQRIANQVAKAKIEADPDLDKEHKKRIRQQEITRARALVGANKKDVMVDITPKEWEAIQAKAISNSQLEKILTNADMDAVRKLATPRESDRAIPKATIRRIEALLSSGRNYTLSEIAENTGVSISTVAKINRKELTSAD